MKTSKKVFYLTAEFRGEDGFYAEELRLHYKNGVLSFDENTTIELLTNEGMLRIVDSREDLKQKHIKAMDVLNSYPTSKL